MSQMLTVTRASNVNIVVHLRGRPAARLNRAYQGIYVLGDPNRLPSTLTVQIPVEELLGNTVLAGDIQKYLDAGFITVLGPDGTAVTGMQDFVNGPPQTYTTAARPAATKFMRGQSIFNSTTNLPNYSDGAGNWRNAAGGIV